VKTGKRWDKNLGITKGKRGREGKEEVPLYSFFKTEKKKRGCGDNSMGQ